MKFPATQLRKPFPNDARQKTPVWPQNSMRRNFSVTGATTALGGLVALLSFGLTAAAETAIPSLPLHRVHFIPPVHHTDALAPSLFAHVPIAAGFHSSFGGLKDCWSVLLKTGTRKGVKGSWTIRANRRRLGARNPRSIAASILDSRCPGNFRLFLLEGKRRG